MRDDPVALAQALMGLGRHAEAIEVYERLAARRPERLSYAMQAARLAVATKRFDLARRLLASVREAFIAFDGESESVTIITAQQARLLRDQLVDEGFDHGAEGLAPDEEPEP